jgi:hypothetical protein
MARTLFIDRIVLEKGSQETITRHEMSMLAESTRCDVLY